MNIEWDPKIGLATVVGAVGTLAILTSIGITWGSVTSKLEAAQAAVVEINKASSKRDDHLAQQAERLGKVETSVSFIVPTLQRIEASLSKERPVLNYPPNPRP